MTNAVAAYDLTIAFDKDMPVAAVEIVDAEMHKVGSALLRNDGKGRRLELSGIPRFLRIHMPDGRLISVTIHNDAVRISRKDIDPTFRSRTATRRIAPAPFVSLPAVVADSRETTAAVFEDRNISKPRHDGWEWSLEGGKRVRDELQWVFPGESARPHDLIGRYGKRRVCMRIPGNVRRVEIDDLVTWPAPAAVKIRLSSRTPLLDALTALLQNSDMIATRDAVDDLLTGGAPKIADPFAGCVLAFLLLRLRRFDEAALRVFTAVAESQIPDGPVIEAWRLLVHAPAEFRQIKRLLVTAVERGIPVYTEGTRLLIDGLIALGEEGAQPLAAFREKVGHVIWRAPVTTLLLEADSSSALPRVSVVFES